MKDMLHLSCVDHSLQPPTTAAPAPKPNDNFGTTAPRGNQEGLPQRDNRRDRNRGGPNWARRGPDAGEGERGRGAPGRIYPDNHQLFVGNLPQDIKDEELKEFFSSKFAADSELLDNLRVLEQSTKKFMAFTMNGLPR